MADALILENADPQTLARADDLYEKAGHEGRANLDAAYKRATWGRRPEDIAAQQAVIGELEGRR